MGGGRGGGGYSKMTQNVTVGGGGLLDLNALNFDKEKYLKFKHQVDAAIYIAKVIRPEFIKRMEENQEHFWWAKPITHHVIGARTCGTFNRGDSCTNGKWHPNFNDLRLHGCTLCLEGLGMVVGHPVVDCKWTKEITWAELQSKTSKK